MKLQNWLPCVLAGALLPSCACLSPGGKTHTLNSDVTPDQALVLLKDGNRRYVNEKKACADDASDRRAILAKGQKPFAVILGCADSRTAPEVLFDQQLGSLFVCRVAGNVTDPVVLGSIEYAVEHLHSPLIVVLGHSKCGAVAASLGGHAEGNVGSLLTHVHPGPVKGDADAKTAAGVVNNVSWQTKSLTKDSAVIRKLVKEGKVRIASGVYSLESGQVTWQ